MKKIYILLLIITYAADSICQGYYEDGYNPMSINWNDPVYADLFNNSCQFMSSQSTSIKTITKWYANDSRWNTMNYGTSSCKWGKFKDFGCYMTCLAMILTDAGDYINPKDLHEFVFSQADCHSDACNLHRINAVEKRPIQKLKYNNEDILNYDKIKTVLDNDGYVLVQVNFTSAAGTLYECKHWILLYDWENLNGKDMFYTADPNSPDDLIKHDLSKYTSCKVRYYIPINKSQSDFTINDSDNKEIKISRGSMFVCNRLVCPDCGPLQKSALECEKTLWVLKNESGFPLGTSENSNSYTLASSALDPGTYYISLAVSNENGFDATVKKIIIEENGVPSSLISLNEEYYNRLPEPCKPCFVSSYKDFYYEGNSWKAVATNTPFKLRVQPYVIYHGGKVNNGDWGDGSDINETTKYGCLEQCSSCCFNMFISHEYKSEGIYLINTGCPFVNDCYMGALIVDCSKSKNSLNISSAINNDWGWGHAYFSGSFSLNSLTNIPKKNNMDYNNQKLILSACKSIELLPGIACEPNNNGKGNYISFEVGVIEGSQGSSTKSAEVFEMPEEKPTLIQENESSNQDIDIFPNPNNGTFTIKIKEGIIENVQVYNTYGKKINDFYNSCHSNECDIKLNTSSTGIYFILIKSSNGTFTRKVVVNK